MKRNTNGFTLMEVLVGSAIFLIVAVAIYSSFTNLIKLASGNQARTLAVQLASEQLEIVRNMPYLNIGLTDGIPVGVLERNKTVSRGGISFDVNLVIRNINLSTSTVQASQRLVEVNVDCPACHNFQPVSLTGQIAPANLQSAGNGGAFVAQVFNANGEPVQGATVDLQSVATSSIRNTDVTNNYGILNVIGVPPGTNMYKIVVSKDGYSTEETFAFGGAGNPNPTKPNVTILNQQVSQASFAIDKLSTLRISSVSPLCVPIANIDFDLIGAKNIGAGVSKYSETLATNSSGILDLNSMEWDTYTLTPRDDSYDVAGINPNSPFSLNPDNNQEIQLVVVPKNGNSLMVSVTDVVTGLPISGVSVAISRSGNDETKITGQGYLSQVDWSLGGGQDIYSNPSQYFNDNGSVDTATSSGDVVLRDFFGLYNTNATGTLESSTFDTGTSSNFYTLSWTPNNQPLLSGASSLKLQFATNASATPLSWDYFGPDGTASTYYTIPESPINAIHNNKRYARYKSFLTTETATVTPKLSSVVFAYTSGCIPPGQVIFQGLSVDEYSISATKSGYNNFSQTVNIINGWQRIDIKMESQ